MRLAGGARRVRLVAHHRDALSIVRPAASSVDKWRVEPMNIKVDVIYEETLSDSDVSTDVRVDKVPAEGVSQN